MVVSSGAVGVGCLKLQLPKRPKELAARQALAAVGQLQLMRYYEDFLTALGLVGLIMAACTAAHPCGLSDASTTMCQLTQCCAASCW